MNTPTIKSAWIDFLICFFFGAYGVHKFREKKIGLGILYLFTGGLLGFGWLYDCIVFFVYAIKITLHYFKYKTDENVPFSTIDVKEKIAKIVRIVIVIYAALLVLLVALVVGFGSTGDNAAVTEPTNTSEQTYFETAPSTTTIPTTAPTTAPATEPSTQPATAPTPPTVAPTTPTAKPTTPTTVPTTPPATEPTTPPTTEPPHTHSFSAATCTTPQTCSCGATSGSAAGHNWKSATCTTPKTCSTCNQTEGSISDHSWTDATCTAPQKCRTCSAENGSPTGHNYSEGTCVTCGSKDPNYSEITYILNTKTKKFHRPTCNHLPTDYRKDSTLTREEIVSQEYTPCGHCDP